MAGQHLSLSAAALPHLPVRGGGRQPAWGLRLDRKLGYLDARPGASVGLERAVGKLAARQRLPLLTAGRPPAGGRPPAPADARPLCLLTHPTRRTEPDELSGG